MSKIKSAEVKKNIVNELANRINQPHYIEYCLDKYLKAKLESINDNEAEKILEKFARKNMVQWNQESFKITHNRLHKSIIEAINEALNLHNG